MGGTNSSKSMMLVRKASCGVVHSGLTERERCGANYREEMKQIMREFPFSIPVSIPKLGKSIRKLSQVPGQHSPGAPDPERRCGCCR